MSDSKRRSVSTAFWDDGYIIDLKPTEKLVFLYLLTNSKTNMLGIYEMPLRKMSFDTGIAVKDLETILKGFERVGKVYYRVGYVILVNFIKNQKLNPNMKKSALDCFSSLPDEIKKLFDNSKEIKGFERLSKALQTLRKIEVETEIEDEEENETEGNEKITFCFESSKWLNIKADDIHLWSDAYPACDVELILKQIGSWLVANPSKRKTQYRRFITNWLKKEQDKGGNKQSSSGKMPVYKGNERIA